MKVEEINVSVLQSGFTTGNGKDQVPWPKILLRRDVNVRTQR
jgi:hypothetical protein